MNQQQIPSITVQGFRGVRELTIANLGNVNLITGPNGAGKTSILEAIHLYAHAGWAQAIRDVLTNQREPPGSPSPDPMVTLQDTMAASAMFHGFPHISENHDPIKISTGRHQPPHVVQIQAKLLTEVTSPKGGRKYLEGPTDYMEDPLDLYAIVVDTENSHQVHPLGLLGRPTSSRHAVLGAALAREQSTSVLLRPNTTRNTAAWDAIAMTNEEQRLVQILQIAEPRITRISTIGDDRPGEGRITAVSLTGKPRPIPLRALGEGINRIYDIIITMLTMPRGIILIDQFDDGLSPASQEKLWETVFQIGRNRGTQVFATTNNQQAADIFKAVAKNSPQESKLVRLDQVNGKNIQATYQ